MRKILVSLSRWASILCLALAVINLHSAAALGSSVVVSVRPTGELMLAGSVDVDGASAVSGQTIFPGSTFRSGAGSPSMLNLHNRSRLEMSAETILKLDFADDYVTGDLKAGRLRISAPAGVTARLTTEGATLLTDSRQPALFSVESVRSGVTTVSVEAGQVEMIFGERRQMVSAGMFLSTDGSPVIPASERRHLGSVKRNVLEFGLVGVLAIITLLLAGNGGDQEPVCFGGTVTITCPTNDPPVPPPPIVCQ